MDEQAEKHETSEDVVHGKGFFILNLLQVERMVQQGAGAEEVMAYLVLVRGTSAWRKEVTTYGANSVATRSGMTHYRSEQALHWLASGATSKSSWTIRIRPPRNVRPGGESWKIRMGWSCHWPTPCSMASAEARSIRPLIESTTM
jgi:hypothetical protein